ncbi:ComEC/Rec2 family competence protein [Portibacter lacus]|uniref:Uncharacterized protein n=1 Tax=Portibacter lacus TaxID=1099794 RepID=A0AA37SSZ9_9BACT|nr:hypothetical protein [Portibacter lacus]GLR19024.1 hypothetical protein GCM10007940_36400 [Portibacter lacus]
MKKINRCKVRMYRAGTGDCFLLKFYAGTRRKFTMLIDGGVWQGSKEYLTPFVENIKDATDGKIDLLVITHEHRDHVLMFDRCSEIFETFEIDQLWFGWTEDDGDPEVAAWKEKYGDKKKALSFAADRMNQLINDQSIRMSLAGNQAENEMYDAKVLFSDVVNGFSELHAAGFDGQKIYKGGLKGMEVVKKLKVNKVRYCRQGEIIKDIKNMEGVKFYVLGPPNMYQQVKKEHGKEGESYDHNKDLEVNDLFSLSVLKDELEPLKDDILPFDREFVIENDQMGKECFSVSNSQIRYEDPMKEWRRIDHDWLYSSGNLALRMNSLTNNLSLALAIEFEESKKVMLFPGDAEFGSWESWHKIKWHQGELKTEDLLNQTVFYKVAHHLSHNGTAASLGLEMMNHSDLVAMATLDFTNISNGWKSTMPNRKIVKELLKRTKGRLILLNDEEVYSDFEERELISTVIEKEKARMNDAEKYEFDRDFDIPKSIKVKTKGQIIEKPLYYEYAVDGR